jgi:hypothetical protein
LRRSLNFITLPRGEAYRCASRSSEGLTATST